MKKKKLKKAKKTLITYFVLRVLVIACMVAQSMNGNWENVLLCVLTLLLFTIPTIFSETLNITLPSTLETIVYIFIFAAEILGEVQSFYTHVIYWDSILHTINGFICAAIGFSLIDLLNTNDNIHINLSPIFVSIVAICFSMTIGIIWEFFEYSVDKLLLKDMQKDTIVKTISSVALDEKKENNPIVVDNIEKTIIYTKDKEVVIEGGYLDLGINDTMKDLFVNFLGAITYSLIGFLYIKNRDKYRFAEEFMLKRRKIEE
ncbi:MAG: hypothetical protein MR031_00300 [Tenericutes bacterium]|nr:hypothetical protein [Mycoplasmatota bacterium]